MSLQNNWSKQQQTLPGKLANVFEKEYIINVLLHKKLWKAKIKASKGKKNYADADAEMPMPKFAIGPYKTHKNLINQAPVRSENTIILWG